MIVVWLFYILQAYHYSYLCFEIMFWVAIQLSVPVFSTFCSDWLNSLLSKSRRVPVWRATGDLLFNFANPQSGACTGGMLLGGGLVQLRLLQPQQMGLKSYGKTCTLIRLRPKCTSCWSTCQDRYFTTSSTIYTAFNCMFPQSASHELPVHRYICVYIYMQSGHRVRDLVIIPQQICWLDRLKQDFSQWKIHVT